MNTNEETTAFAEPGENHIIDYIVPGTGRGGYSGEDLAEIRLRYPRAEIVNLAEFRAAIEAREAYPVEWSEVDEERYDEMLCILPPAVHTAGGFMVGEASDHHGPGGAVRFAAYVARGGKFYAASRAMTVAEFRAEVG